MKSIKDQWEGGHPMKKSRTVMIRKSIIFILGMYILALGIAFSVKSNLGVSPVSSIPFVLSRIFDVSLGTTTIIVYLFYMLLQAVILRRDYKLKNLFQIIVSFLFGYFTDAAIWTISFLPATENYIIRFIYLAAGIACVALGVLFYLTTSLIALPTDGTVQAISFKGGFKLHKVKIAYDCSSTLIALALSLIFLRKIDGIGVGTVISALGVGKMLGVFTKLLKSRIHNYANHCESVEENPSAVA
jgi:uncharacterized membrane protein YczE